MREIPGIPYSFNDPELLALALSHRSIGRQNNERLEFLGDSVLNFVIAARLFDLRTDNNEGELSRLRARVVRGHTLAKLASGLKLGEYIKLGEGELPMRWKPSLALFILMAVSSFVRLPYCMCVIRL